MIFTDRFVYVHEPKTGGTFVTSMLFRLYGLRWTRLTHLYLAFGRPVLTQQTGFSNWLPTGAGLLSFETTEEALAGMTEINSN